MQNLREKSKSFLQEPYKGETTQNQLYSAD